MSALAPFRVGWCPSAFQPMMSGDGLVVRVKPRGGTLSLDQADGLAKAAARHGNGELDLTSRANLQIRGVRHGTHALLLGDLARLGLLDADPAADAVRNVVSSPLAGFDPSAILDIRPVVTALENRIAGDTVFHALPAKFGFRVDDGGRLGLGDVSGDVGFEGITAEQGGANFVVRLGGADEAAGLCTPEDVPSVAAALARTFVEARKDHPNLRRMRDLVHRDGPSRVLERAGRDACSAPGPARATGIDLAVGRHELAPALRFVGVAAPFGRLGAAQLAALAEASERCGAGSLRLTPWRAIVVPGLCVEASHRLAVDAARSGWIIDPADPRLRVAACPGAPGCHRGTTAVLDDAARVAAALPVRFGADIAVHVSGCAKGCACGKESPLTLVAHDGVYDVVANGRASDPPLVRDLGIAAALRWVSAGPGVARP